MQKMQSNNMFSFMTTSIRIDPADIAKLIEEQALKHRLTIGPKETGRVVEAGDGIARVSGIPGVMSEEMVLFQNGVFGLAMNLERDHVGIIILGDYSKIQQNDIVQRTGKVLQIPVGKELLGRVVNPLGQPLDGRGSINCTRFETVETDAPGIVDREPVNKPLQTGLKSVDSMTAIGRGQRELIIGDRKTGKTTLAIDTILNQVRDDVTCVYVAIGQKMSTIASVVDTLSRHGALENCIVVAATASDSAPLQYMAPFAGCTMAEYFRNNGGDSLIVYDDLSKHAVAYREISLLLRRPPGREAFPGDIFYLHSRLLERAAKMHPNQGNGSLTALPIIETQQGDYAAYIPTNLISITDGQIYLQSDLFHSGFRPAINSGLSVSRVGGKAQSKAMKKVAIRLRMDLAQYREVASFSQLTSDLDAATMAQISRGERLAEILKQPLHEPMSMEKQVCSIWAVSNGKLDKVPLGDVARYEKEWLTFLENIYPVILETIAQTGDLDNNTEQKLIEASGKFNDVFVTTMPNVSELQPVTTESAKQGEEKRVG